MTWLDGLFVAVVFLLLLALCWAPSLFEWLGERREREPVEKTLERVSKRGDSLDDSEA